MVPVAMMVMAIFHRDPRWEPTKTVAPKGGCWLIVDVFEERKKNFKPLKYCSALYSHA